jgi:ribose transport system substrate-binding protein
MRTPVRTASSFVLAAALAFGALAGCGSSASGERENAKGSAAAQPVSYFDDLTEKFYGSLDTAPPEDSPPAAKGAHIYAVPYGVAAPSSEYWLQGLRDATDALGWKLTVVDGQFNSATQTDGIRQAVAAKADGIVTYVLDCAAVQAGAQQAREAGIPLIYVSGFDCDELGADGPDTAYPIGNFNVLGTDEGRGDYIDFYEQMGALQAYWAVSKTEGKMKAIVIDEIDAQVTKSITDGFLDAADMCSECQVVEKIDIVAADFGPALQDKVSQALLSHPDANVVMANYDDIVVSGVAAAVRASGRAGDILVTGTPGYEANIELLHDGGQDMASSFSVPWEAWASIDRLNRILNDDMELPDIGMGLTITDETHNLTPKGAAWSPEVDFATLYKKAWGVQ